MKASIPARPSSWAKAPEITLEANPASTDAAKLERWREGGVNRLSLGVQGFDPRALAEYERCFAVPATVHATCEDYRAAASIDLEHDAADGDGRVRCPMLVLWGEKGVINRLFKPVEDWKRVADDVRGHMLPCGHFLAEEAPDATLNEMLAFLGDY